MEEMNVLFAMLKEVLREKKIRYSEVAGHLDLAESSVKRIFSQKSCSTEQLNQMCTLAGISLFDLIALAKNREIESYTLEEGVESELAKKLDTFLFFRQAVIHKNLEVVLEKMSLDRKKAQKHLRLLEKLNLLEVHASDRLVFPKRGVLKMRDGGELQRALYRRWIPSFMEEAVTSRHDEFLVKAFSMRVSEAAKKRFLDDFEVSYRELLNRSQLELRSGKKDLKALGVVFATGPRRLGELTTPGI